MSTLMKSKRNSSAQTLQHGGVLPAAGAGRLHRPQHPQDPQHPGGVQPRAPALRDLRHQGLTCGFRN